MTLEEIKEQVAKEYGFYNWDSITALDLGDRIINQIAERFAQSQTQELQEQNVELVSALHVIKNLQSLIEYPKDTPIEHSGEAEAIHQMFNVIDILLTKYNHLNKKP